MGAPPAHRIRQWLTAAGKSADTAGPVRDRVIVAGQFIENSGRVPDAFDLLRGIDFSKPVTVVRQLPMGVYVQFAGRHRGAWFTHAGLTPDQVGLAEGQRVRKLFRPIGAVAALESTARPINDWWTHGRLQEHLDPTGSIRHDTRAYGQHTLGGGRQYLVIDRFQMQELP